MYVCMYVYIYGHISFNKRCMFIHTDHVTIYIYTHIKPGGRRGLCVYDPGRQPLKFLLTGLLVTVHKYT